MTDLRQIRERRLGLSSRDWLIAMLCVIAIILEFAPRVGFVDSFSLPPLSTIAVHTWQLIIDGEVWREHLVYTISEIALAFILASVLGVAFGLLLWRINVLRQIFDPWLSIFYAIPTFAVYPLLVVMVGIGIVPIVILATILAIISVVTATINGLDSAPRMAIQLGRSLRLTPLEQTVKILIPSIIEHIAVGMRLALSFSIIGVMASEFILSTRGLGYFISYKFEHFSMPEMYGGIVLVLLLAVVVNVIFEMLLRARHVKIYG